MEWLLSMQLLVAKPEAQRETEFRREWHLSEYACDLARQELRILARTVLVTSRCGRVPYRLLDGPVPLRGTTWGQG